MNEGKNGERWARALRTLADQMSAITGALLVSRSRVRGGDVEHAIASVVVAPPPKHLMRLFLDGEFVALDFPSEPTPELSGLRAFRAILQADFPLAMEELAECVSLASRTHPEERAERSQVDAAFLALVIALWNDFAPPKEVLAAATAPSRGQSMELERRRQRTRALAALATGSPSGALASPDPLTEVWARAALGMDVRDALMRARKTTSHRLVQAQRWILLAELHEFLGESTEAISLRLDAEALELPREVIELCYDRARDAGLRCRIAGRLVA